jgi:hypothetical protein
MKNHKYNNGNLQQIQKINLVEYLSKEITAP